MDPIKLEIYRSLYTSVAEEMGVSLRRTAFSPNIKERRDYSCAVFDRHGRLIAQGDHMPVHLGSMPMSVRAAIKHSRMEPGDVVILNDPYAGGTHLPDVTVVAPVFESGRAGEWESGRAGERENEVSFASPPLPPLSRSLTLPLSCSPTLPLPRSPTLSLPRSPPLLRRQPRPSRRYWRRDARLYGIGH